MRFAPRAAFCGPWSAAAAAASRQLEPTARQEQCVRCWAEHRSGQAAGSDGRYSSSASGRAAVASAASAWTDGDGIASGFLFRPFSATSSCIPSVSKCVIFSL
ncbi:unnamed protein product [Prorocentrum cordatum]|uniref:Secreted protein n=1 Tax=Prorocentrum cordatum TaxID=2364126 RepID=A0ABN9PAW4_9DINO|nr:unnamed protein product [Polarella glacialis]